MTKYLQSCSLALFCAMADISANAQSISPATLNASGASSVLGGNIYEYSIAEMTVVSTSSYNGGIVTSGILQPASVSVESISNVDLFNSLYGVYPTPTSSTVYIDLKGSEAPTALVIYDVAGKLVQQIASPQFTNKRYALDLSTLAAGTYYLRLQSQQNQFNIKLLKD
jgi:hypothetical protein